MTRDSFKIRGVVATLGKANAFVFLLKVLLFLVCCILHVVYIQIWKFCENCRN